MSFVWQQGGKIVEMLLQMLLSVMVARLLGPGLSGVYASIGAVEGTLATLIAFGFEDSMTNFLGRHADDAGVVSYLLRQIMARRVLYAVLSMGTLVLFSGLVARWQHVVGYEWGIMLLAVYGVLSTISTLMTLSLIALFDVRVNNVMRAISLTIQLALAYTLIRSGYGLAGAIWSQLVGTSLFLAGLAPSIGRRMKSKPKPVPLRPVLRLGMGLWMKSVLDLAIGKQLPLLVLGAFHTPAVFIGYFNAGFNAEFTAEMMLVGGLGGIALASAARLLERQGREGLAQAWRLNVRLTTVLAVPTILLFMFQSQRTIGLLYGSRFLPATAPFMCISALSIVSRAFGGGANSTVMSAGGRVRLVVYQYIVGGLSSVVLCPLVVLVTPGYSPMDHVIAVASAVAFSQIVVSVMGFGFVRRTYGIRFPLVFTLKVIACGSLAGASTLWLRIPEGLWQDSQRTQFVVLLWQMVLLAAQFAVVFYWLARLLKPLSAEDYEVAVKASRRMPRLIRPLVGEPIPSSAAESGSPDAEQEPIVRDE